MSRSKKDSRHRAREAALQILYQWQIGQTDVERAAAIFFDHQCPDAAPPADAVRDFCRGKIAHYKIPRYVIPTDEFPMTVTGKIQKYQVLL